MMVRRGVWRWATLGVAVGTAILMMSACGFDGVATGAAGLGAGTGPDARAAGEGGGAALGDGGQSVLQPGDAAGDALVDGAIVDGALVDATSGADAGPCPAACSSCTGSTCNLQCAAGLCTGKKITCPPGRPCNVTCADANACVGAKVDCTAASACNVECSGFHACVSVAIDCGGGACRLACGPNGQTCVGVSLNAVSAASACVECHGAGGQPGCISLDIAPPASVGACTKSCSFGACVALGSGFNACGDVASCL